jgi:Mrp family chromosome partitioning ATPase
MRERLDQMLHLSDVIVFDSPPLLGTADASVLAALCSAVLLVVDSRRTRRGLVLEGKATLDQVGGHVIGVVLNRVRRSRGGYGRYSVSAMAGASRWRRILSAGPVRFGAR